MVELDLIYFITSHLTFIVEKDMFLLNCFSPFWHIF